MSARAACRLESLGYSHVHRYVAGKTDWLAFRLPIEGNTAESQRIGDLARTDTPTCHLTERVASVLSRLNDSRWDFCVVVHCDRVVQGLLPATAPQNDDEVQHLMDDQVQSFRPHAELTQVLEAMRKGKLDRAVVTNSDGQLLGAFLRTDVEQASMTH